MTLPSDDLFGPGSGAVAVRVGTIAMHAALLESDIETLASSIGDIRQDEVAGVGVERAMRTIGHVLAESYGAEDEHEFVANILALLADVRSALERRNLVVHGLWTVERPGQYFVWKPKRRDKTTAEWVDGERLTNADLEEIVATLRCLHESTRAAWSTAASHPRRPSPIARQRLNPKVRVIRGDHDPAG